MSAVEQSILGVGALLGAVLLVMVVRAILRVVRYIIIGAQVIAAAGMLMGLYWLYHPKAVPKQVVTYAAAARYQANQAISAKVSKLETSDPALAQVVSTVREIIAVETGMYGSANRGR